MITEKQIKKHKFFTTNGSDIWKVKTVDCITKVELVNCETAEPGTCVLGEAEAKKFFPIKMPKIKRHLPAARERRLGKKTKKKKENIRAQSVRTAGSGIRKGRKPSSQYLGVRLNKNTKKIRYVAQVNRGGKFVHLGTFNIEEMAAAAVQEHLGNKVEAGRLRKLAEEKTNEKIKEVKRATAFDCTSCGKGYPCKPDRCGKCGGSSFSPARPEEREVEK